LQRRWKGLLIQTGKMNKNDALIQELLRELSSAKNIVEQDAVATEFCLDGLPEGIASIARACVLFHWFDKKVIEVFLPSSLNTQLQPAQVYEQIQGLPFVETFPWGSSFQDLTREGLLQRYAQTKPMFLQQMAKLAISAYEKQQDYKKGAIEQLFCSIIAGEHEESRKLLSTLQEDAYKRRDWHYLGDLLDVQKEAESFSFVRPLPVDAGSWFLRGLVSHARGELEQAISDYKRAIVLDPKNARACVHCGTAYDERGRTGRAHALYNRALVIAPDLVEALAARGRFLKRLGNYTAALNDFNAAIQRHGEDPMLHCDKGIILNEQGKYQEALEAFDASLQLDPNNAVSSRGKEAALAGLKQKEEVSASSANGEAQEKSPPIRTGLQVDPDNPVSSQGKEVTLTGLKQKEEVPTSSTNSEAQEKSPSQHCLYRVPSSGSFKGALHPPAPLRGIRTDLSQHSHQVRPMRRRNPLPLRVGCGAMVAAVILGALFLFNAKKGSFIIGIMATATAEKTTTATVIGKDNATATAIAEKNVWATTIARHNATATAIAKNTNPYENWGDVVFNDPLTKPDNWLPRTNDSSNGYCQFESDGYHVRETATHSLYVCASKTEVSYSNFLFEARVILGQGGCGGIVLYYNIDAGSGYVFFVCSDGSYRLSQYSDSNNPVILLAGKTNVDSGENALAVGIVSDLLVMYLNNRVLQSIAVSNSGLHGYIGFLADDKSNDTENIYTNARLQAFAPGHGS
jgi:tetratricopeptide (TPR) repeat protein